jgi:hypothetical protein
MSKTIRSPFIVLIALAIALPCHADNFVHFKKKAAAGGGGGCADETGYTFRENFEAPGPCKTWTTELETGSIVWNQSTSGLSLEGSYCLRLDRSTVHVTIPTVDLNDPKHIYYAFKIRKSFTPASDERIFFLVYVDGGANGTHIIWRPNDSYQISVHFAGYGLATTTKTFNNNQTYYIKLHETHHVGQLYWSDDGVNWTIDLDVSDTGYEGHGMNRLRLYQSVEEGYNYFDDIRISTSDINW